jgi:hypothetical protein
MLKRKTFAGALAATLALAVAFPASAEPVSAFRPGFGCFRVTVEGLNIRDRPFSTAAVIGTARQGDILVKRRRWCTLRGFWCAVRYGSIEGYADKSFMEVIRCPGALRG